MTGYNVSLQGNITGFKKVSSAITQYNALFASGTKEQDTFANAVSVTNGNLGTYLTGLNGANASLGGYVISLVGATVKTIILKVATIALNSAITMGASLIISGIVSAISEWIHKTENMISASEGAIEKIKSINDELKNNQKTISDTAKRYAELAQGVDQLTGKNISLSNEDYEEFLTLSNQLAEMFPTLTRNYNDNGDAIVQLSGDVDTIVGSLQNFIEAQRDLANRQIVDELPTVFDGIAVKSNRYEQQLSDLENRRDTLVKSLGDVQGEEFSSNFMEGFSNKWIEISGDNLEVISQMRNDYMKILKEVNIDFEELTPTYEIKDGIEIPVGFTFKINSSDENVEKAKNTIDGKIQELAAQYETDINKLNEEIDTINKKNKANWLSLSSSIFAWLSTDDSFKVMDDTMQATVQNIVNSLDWGGLNFSSWEDAKQYIQENILSLFNTSEGKETLENIEMMFGIQTQFNNGDISAEKYQQKLQNFLNSIKNLPPETKKSVLLLLGIQTNDDGTTTSDVDTMLENVKKKLKGTEFDSKVVELTLDELKIASELEIPEGVLLTWDELIVKIKEVQGSTSDADTDILSISQTISDLQDLNSALDNLGSAMTNLNSKGNFTLGDLDSIADYFLGLEQTAYNTEAVNTALKTLGDGNSTLEQQSDAINTLADQYLKTSGILDDLNDENAELVKLQLQRMGITNAEEIVNATLNGILQSQAEIESTLAQHKSIVTGETLTLSNVTAGEIQMLLDEGNITGDTANQMVALAIKKQLVNGTSLGVSADINNLISLCRMLGATTTALDTYNKVKNGANGMPASVIEQYKKEAEKELQSAVQIGEDALKTIYNHPSDASSSSSPTSETFNWLETLISRIEHRITNFGKTVSSVWKNWSDRNHAVVQEMSAINEEILIQQRAYDAYMAKAESVGLSSYYQALVQNGGFHMENITDDTLKEQIKNYQEFYEKALACSDAVTDLRGDLADLAQTRFDNIAAQFNEQISLIEHESGMLESRLDQIQAKGYLAGGSYYTELIQLEQDNIAFLQGEYSSLTGSLQEALANGTVEQYSEQWYDMVSSINDVQEAIEDANSSLIDYQNNLRQLNWDIFDKTQEYISRIPSESGFLMDLMGNSDLYHENGTFNELGNAAVGLHAVNFNTYMAQADDYAKELLAIDKEISDDPYNTTLIERRQELLELQQDSIKAAEDEKQSMKDLVSDGYDVMLDALQKLIDKRKDAMQAEKDLYDYQKSIAEQTKTIAQYQKQLSAFSSDNSEETQAAIQKIKVSLEEAEQNLAESEYDQWLSDQEKMLDNLYDETEEWVNQRLDDLNGIILEIIDNTNANADSIKETLAAVGEDVGYSLTPEMEKIWTASDGISQVVSQYSNHFNSHATTVQAALSNIQSLIQQMAGASNATAAGDINGIKQNTAAITGMSAVPNTSASAKPVNATGNSGLSAGVSPWGSWFISQKDSFDKSKLNAESSIVDRLKLRDFASDFQYRKNYYSAMGGTGTYTGSASQNAWMIAQMKAHGFQKGGIIGSAIHSAGEDGFILARTGEGILPVEMMPEWEEFISALPQLNNRNHFLLDIPELPHYNPSANRTVNSGDVTLQIDGIQMYGVNDPEQFTNSLVDALSTNTRIRKVLVDNTIGVSLGKNSLLSRSR